MHAHHILVVGGAGYIGAQITYHLFAAGYTVTVLDALHHGQSPHRLRAWARVVVGDYGDRSLLDALFRQSDIAAVIHCGGVSDKREAAQLYTGNVVKTQVLLDAMRNAGVRHLIFSSSTAVYGVPTHLPANEQTALAPVTPAARTQVAVEYLLHDYSQTYDFSYVSLRFANVAGALPQVGLGLFSGHEQSLIPAVLTALYDEQLITVYGADFDTVDGTAMRDYIHIHDLADVYLLALTYLVEHGITDVFVVGSGQEHSVKQVIAAAEKVTGCRAQITVSSPRSYSPPVRCVQASKAQHMLEWRPAYSSLALILASAHQWHWQVRNSLTD